MWPKSKAEAGSCVRVNYLLHSEQLLVNSVIKQELIPHQACPGCASSSKEHEQVTRMPEDFSLEAPRQLHPIAQGWEFIRKAELMVLSALQPLLLEGLTSEPIKGLQY